MLANLFPHGWAHYLAGGALLGVAVAVLFVVTGRVGGMSTVFSTTLSWASRRPFFQQPAFLESREWRLWLAAGLVIGAACWWAFLGPAGGVHTEVAPWRLFAGGLLVGYGARRSGGCTSGHGICGLGHLQLPSALAVLVFMATAIAVANLLAVLS